MKKINRLLIILVSILLIYYPISVQAAPKVKISNSKLTLNIGKSRKLSISGLTSDDKVKWKTSNKKVATVSSKGKVTAAAEGTAKITATVNKKSYTCTVTVKPKILSEAEKVKNISYETYITDNSLVVSFKNNNVKSTSDILALSVSASFYDKSDRLIYKSVADSTHYQVASGKEFLSVFELPRENNYPYIK